MRLGLLADIHSYLAETRRALELFKERGVDRVVTLGDTIHCQGRREEAREVAQLLLDVDAVGVWGNHDYDLRPDAQQRAQTDFAPVVLEFMAKMQPRVVLGDCHFSHKEASIDAHVKDQIWDVHDSHLTLPERAALSFAAAPQRWHFIGHHHQWWAATPTTQPVWEGAGPLTFQTGERYFISLGAGREGWCAIMDTDLAHFEPLWCGIPK